MSNELVPGGGGAIVPGGSAGGAVGEHIGDVSLDRGHAPVAGADQGARVPSGGLLIVNDLLPRLGLSDEQKQITFAWMKQNIARLEELREEAMIEERIALDKREQAEAIATMRGKWGAAYEGNIRKVHGWLLDMLGADATEELMRARDFEGTAIFNKPEVLEALLEAARTTLSSDDTADRAAAVQALRAEWGGNYDVSIGLIKRHIESLPESVQHGLHWARDEHGVLLFNRPAGLRWILHVATRRPANGAGGPSPDLSARRRGLEGWMGKGDARYWKDDAVQAEYRELLGQGVTNDTRHSTAESDVERRIAEIEKLMSARKGSAEYKSYYDDPSVQRELRELYDRRAQHRGK